VLVNSVYVYVILFIVFSTFSKELQFLSEEQLLLEEALNLTQTLYDINFLRTLGFGTGACE